MSTSVSPNSWIDQLSQEIRTLVLTKILEISNKQLEFLTQRRMTFEEANRWGTVQMNLLRARYTRESPNC